MPATSQAHREETMTITTGQEVEAILQDDCDLDGLPEELRTPAVCLAAVRQDGLMLKRVPEALRTPAICAAAVRQNGLALRWVPENMKTPEICADAVCSSGWAVKHVPADLLTEDLCLVAARDAGAEALELMPHEMVTRRICGAAAARDDIDPETVWQDVCEWRDAVLIQGGRHENQVAIAGRITLDEARAHGVDQFLPRRDVDGAGDDV